jgi:hypothetical protein
MTTQTKTNTAPTAAERRDQLAAQLADLAERRGAVAAELVDTTNLWRAALDAGQSGEVEARRRRDLEHSLADIHSAAEQLAEWHAEACSQVERERQLLELQRAEAELTELQQRAADLSTVLGRQLVAAVDASAKRVGAILATRAEAAAVHGRLATLPASIENQRHALGLAVAPSSSAGTWIAGRWAPDVHAPVVHVGVIVPGLPPTPNNGTPSAMHQAAAALGSPLHDDSARLVAEAIGRAAAAKVA